jgi:alpha-L-fucosidase
MGSHGDYATPEQAPPVLQPQGPWEYCMTASDSWGYRPSDTNFKTVTQLVHTFCDVIGMGGNLLLAIGPKEDGTFTAEHEAQLRGLGAWIHKHDEAVYPTGAGLPFGHFFGPSTLSADRTTLYLFCLQPPTTAIAIKGLHSAISKAEVLGSGVPVTHQSSGGAAWLGVPGVKWLTVPAGAHDEHCTVIKVTLAEPCNLYRGEGQAIEVN